MNGKKEEFVRRLHGGEVFTSTRSCPAKINLFLEVTGKREDGYHTIESVMQKVALCDRVTLTLSQGEGIVIRSNDRTLPTGEKNLCHRAYTAYMQASGITAHADMLIEKHIPVAAGLAGGSTDAAGVLRILDNTIGALSQKELAALALSLGADVPFCLFRSASLCKGLGEELSYITPLSDCFIVLAKDKRESVSTKDAYTWIDSLTYTPVFADSIAKALQSKELEVIAGAMMNRFEEVILPRCPSVQRIKASLMANGAIAAMMSGSGPSVFGIFKKEEEALRARDLLRAENCYVFTARPWR